MSVPQFDKDLAEIIKRLPPGTELVIPIKGPPYLRMKR